MQIDLVFIIKILGVWLGVFSRMTIPFWRKLYQGKASKFNLKYLTKTIASLFLSSVFTILLFPKLEIDKTSIINFEGFFVLFCLCFGFGFGFNSILIEISQWFEK